MTTAFKSQTAPAPIAMSIRAHGKTLALKIDALRAGAAKLVLDEARGKTGAFEALTDLYLKLKILEFALELNGQAVELARQEDAHNDACWRAAIQTLDPDEIVEGISKGGCCAKCTPGVNGGCVITNPAPHAGPTCGHPILTKDLQFIDEVGKRHFRYEKNPRALEIYKAACRKLKVSL
jgi:hypothetical protein